MGSVTIPAVKRVNYFEHQFLHVDEFTDEQKYHLQMRRRINRMHKGGIAWGLVVSKSGDKEISISEGLAFDKQGHEIVIPADTQVELLSASAGQELYVTVKYGPEKTTDTSNETGAEGDTRRQENTVVTWKTARPSTDAGEIILGKATIDQDGNIKDDIGTKERQEIGEEDGENGNGEEKKYLPLTGGTIQPDPQFENRTVPAVTIKKTKGGVSLKLENGDLVVDGTISDRGGVIRSARNVPSRILGTEDLADLEGTTASCFACRFLNGSGQRISPGDVVKLKRSPRQARASGGDNRVPLAEVDLADAENHTDLIGLAAGGMTDTSSADEKHQGEDPKSVEDGRELLVITLGPFSICRADATKTPIEIGDMLTTSSNPGHAQKATNPKIGSILGKALEPLDSGTGTVAVFVNVR